MKRLLLGGLLAIAVYGISGTYYVDGSNARVMSSEVPSEIVRYVLAGLGLLAPWVLARLTPGAKATIRAVCVWVVGKIDGEEYVPAPTPAPTPKPIDVIKDAFTDSVEGLISELIRRLFAKKATVSQIDKAVELAKDLCCTPTQSFVVESAHLTGNAETKP